MKTPPQARTDPRWARVLARDTAADGTFVYAVASTGIYCRPSCPARRPKAEHVSFHTGAAAAAAAGFRPCRRCHPDRPADHGPAAAITAACRRLEAAGGEEAPPTVAALARAAGMAPSRFHRAFAAATGLTPRAFATAARAARVRGALRRSPSVTAAAYDAGFNSSGRFYAAAPRALGMAPGAFRQGGAGSQIHFAVGHSWLGPVLAAASVRGICAILLGENPLALEAELRALFPQAEVASGGAGFRQRLAQVIALVEHPGAGHTLPLDLQGTAFQRRVWQALTRIPPGSRISYGALARRLRLPHGARAVANACAANTLAIAVPCHRAVRASGALAGYRWGAARKQALLQREAKP